jgi:hypothetical protein
MITNRSADSQGVRAVICLQFSSEGDAAKLAEFKRRLIESPAVLHCIDCNGSFDFMAEACCSTMGDYVSWIEQVRTEGRGLITMLDHVLICRRYLSRTADEEALWVPTNAGLRRITLTSIERVEAEGDYVRIRAASGEYLLHATLRSLEKRLASSGFLKLHRSLLVRRDLVDTLLHDDHGWVCRLGDGSLHRLPRARVHAIRVALGAESSTSDAASPTLVAVHRPAPEPHRILAENEALLG